MLFVVHFLINYFCVDINTFSKVVWKQILHTKEENNKFKFYLTDMKTISYSSGSPKQTNFSIALIRSLEDQNTKRRKRRRRRRRRRRRKRRRKRRRRRSRRRRSRERRLKSSKKTLFHYGFCFYF
jgi:hypothetical protein